MRILFVSLFFTSFLFAGNGFISVNELQQKLHDKNLVILDVTDEATYKQGHILNAVLTDVSKFRKKEGSFEVMSDYSDVQRLLRTLGINDDSQIVIYGHGKKKELNKESYLALVLIIHGAKNVSILNGGYLAWTFQSSLLSSTDTVRPKDGNITVSYNPDILVNMNYVKNRIGKVVMLDARPPELYYGITLSKGVKRPGHIKGAVSSFWQDKFLKDETLRNDKELKEIFLNGYDLNSSDEVISYCTGGMQASMNWYILYSYFGFKNAKLYDASLREWGNEKDTPMVRFKWETFK